MCWVLKRENKVIFYYYDIWYQCTFMFWGIHRFTLQLASGRVLLCWLGRVCHLAFWKRLIVFTGKIPTLPAFLGPTPLQAKTRLGQMNVYFCKLEGDWQSHVTNLSSWPGVTWEFRGAPCLGGQQTNRESFHLRNRPWLQGKIIVILRNVWDC